MKCVQMKGQSYSCRQSFITLPTNLRTKLISPDTRFLQLKYSRFGKKNRHSSSSVIINPCCWLLNRISLELLLYAVSRQKPWHQPDSPTSVGLKVWRIHIWTGQGDPRSKRRPALLQSSEASIQLPPWWTVNSTTHRTSRSCPAQGKLQRGKALNL